MSNDKKFTMSTDTDLHFDMLADKSKLKLVPNYNTPIIKEDNEQSSVSEVDNNFNLDANSSDESDKFNKEKSDTPIQNHSETRNNNMSNNNSFISESKEHSSNNYDNVRNNFNSGIYDDANNKIPQNNVQTHNIHELYSNNAEVPYDLLDEQTKKIKKMEMYAELLSIKRSGIQLTREYSLNSDYNEMAFEVQYWNTHQKKKDAVDIGKNFMINAVTALEFMNESYDPFGLKLKGWSEQLELNKDSYNNVFGELYEKYKNTGRKVEPEIKLILMVGASAASFHASKKMAESLPGLDSVLQSNPDLLTKLQGAINKNISDQGNEKKEDPAVSQQKMYEQMQKLKKQQQQFSELRKQQEKVDENNKKLSEQINAVSSNKKQDNEDRPDINNILNKIKAQNAARKADDILNDNISDDSDERVSVNSNKSNSSKKSSSAETITLGSDGKPKRKKRGAKSTISIVTG
tara:strand:+ start:6017 stop:7402 length:1386 start_codon:yes stop_codon:yes gene_type:complete